MSKVALITDQHFGARNDAPQFLDFFEKFYDEVFFPKLKEEKIKTVLILGDTFDRRKYVNFNTLKRTKEMFFDRLYEENIEVYMLIGNHDTYFKNTNDVNSIDLLLKEYGNITIIDRPKTINIDRRNPSQTICMIPWICADNYDDCMNEINNTKAKICAGHFEIAGFAMYKGFKSEEGLDRDVFRNFEYTFSGHYHHKSNIRNIHYLGNPYEITWHDYSDPRGFHIFDFNDSSLEFVENKNNIFFRLSYNDGSLEEGAVLISDLDSQMEKVRNAFVKVIVISKQNPYLFDQWMDKLYSYEPIEVTIIEDYTDPLENSEDDVDQAEDTLTILNKFVDNLSEDGIDNNKLKVILRELYIESMSSES